ncbi:MAG: hypothetical protein HY390_06030 [Deltaproteobacteria bacterium]|nr:hypothetical protein [Deltaproteobacteria bacterium]
MNTLTFSALVCAFMACIFAIVTASKSLKDERYRWFVILCSLISIWNFLFFFTRIFEIQVLERLYGLLTVMLGPCALYFFLQFVENLNEKHTRAHQALTSIYVISTALALGIFLPHPTVFWFIHGAFAYSALLVGYVFYLLYQNLNQTKMSAPDKKRQRYLILLGLVTLLMLFFDQLRQIGLPLTSFGNLFLVLYLYFIYQLITKKRLLDLEDLTAKGFLFFILSAILTIIYATLVFWVEAGTLFLFNTFVASFVILILFEPIKAITEKLTNHLFLKDRKKMEAALQQTIEKIVAISDIRDLSHEVLGGLKKVLHATQAHFFLLDPAGLSYKLLQSLAPKASKPESMEILVTHDLMKYLLRQHPTPISTHFIRREILEGSRWLAKDRLETILQLFEKLETEAAFAFILDNKILGFCMFMNDKLDAPYSLAILELLAPLSKQIAYTLRNLEVYEKIRERDRLATLGEMSAGLAHEIKNPLGSIKGAAQYLETPDIPKTQKEFLDIILHEVNRLDGVVHQFLNYAKPLPQQLQTIDLVAILKKALQNQQPEFPKNIELVTEFDPEPYIILGDPEQLNQVFLNLILNAVQAMPQGGRLKIAAKHQKKQVEITFEDTGEGIEEQDLKNIFMPFFTTKHQGSGLGLPICQKIIRLHQGQLQVESKLHAGTKLTITLPVRSL